MSETKFSSLEDFSKRNINWRRRGAKDDPDYQTNILQRLNTVTTWDDSTHQSNFLSHVDSTPSVISTPGTNISSVRRMYLYRSCHVGHPSSADSLNYNKGTFGQPIPFSPTPSVTRPQTVKCDTSSLSSWPDPHISSSSNSNPFFNSFLFVY